MTVNVLTWHCVVLWLYVVFVAVCVVIVAVCYCGCGGVVTMSLYVVYVLLL